MTDNRNDSRWAGPVLVGIDGSDSSKEALRWAAEQARLSGEHLDIVATWERPHTFDRSGPAPKVADAEANTRILVEAVVAEVLGATSEPARTVSVLPGHPAQVLADRSRDAGLLVVGSRGHGEFTGMLLGSVSQYLVTHAHCPVAIIRQAAS